MPAAEEARHHGLGDAGGEAGGDGRVGRGAALLEDLGAGLGGRRMAGRDRRALTGGKPWRLATLVADRGPGRPRSLARRAETAETRNEEAE